MLVALAVLAIADLVVGVSNDAVNFLNSAIGSKAVSFKTIIIVASLGVALGAMSSSGMMEVARKGIFNPREFVFDEIMIIFTAVMLTDILLLISSTHLVYQPQLLFRLSSSCLVQRYVLPYSRFQQMKPKPFLI